MASGSAMPLNQETTYKFVKRTASKFEWGDLSEDTVIDIGCGRGMYGAACILENFPNVKSIIALDIDPKEIEGLTIQSPRIIRVQADILKRDDIRPYEGKIDKAISTHVIHQILNKQKAFKNVYRLLKPGGQAAFLFTTDMGMFHVLESLRSDSKYKDYYQGSDLMRMYENQLKADDYREMLEKIGFVVNEISDEKDYFPNTCFGFFEMSLHTAVSKAFTVPPELVLELNNAASYIYQKNYCDQKSTYTSTEMSIFVTKPLESSTRCSSS